MRFRNRRVGLKKMRRKILIFHEVSVVMTKNGRFFCKYQHQFAVCGWVLRIPALKSTGRVNKWSITVPCAVITGCLTVLVSGVFHLRIPSPIRSGGGIGGYSYKGGILK